MLEIFPSEEYLIEKYNTLYDKVVNKVCEFYHPDNVCGESRNTELIGNMIYSHCYIKIRIGDFIISNNKKQKHLIQDYYMIIKLNLDKYLGAIRPFNNFEIRINGWRGVVEYNEYKNTYYHSHLPSNNGGYCMGTGDLMDIHSDCIQSETFEEFLIHFESLLGILENSIQWESLEGGPYRRIENVLNTPNYPGTPANTVFNEDEISLLSTLVFTEKIKLPIQYNPNSNRIEISESKFEIFQEELTQAVIKHNYNSFLAYRIGDNYVCINSSRIEDELNRVTSRVADSLISFKNQIIRTQLKSNINELEKTKTWVPEQPLKQWLQELCKYFVLYRVAKKAYRENIHKRIAHLKYS